MCDRYRGKVLVLGLDDRVVLAVVRSLGRYGLDVDLAWCPDTSPAIHSRYVTVRRDLPNYDGADGRWKPAFIALLQAEKYDMVIPCNESVLLPLQANRSAVEPYGNIYLLDDRSFTVASSKLESQRLAASLNIPTPRSFTAGKTTSAAQLCRELSPPLYVKPLTSVTLDAPTSRKSVVRVETQHELEKVLDALEPDEQVCVCEHVEGRGVGVEVLADQGEVLVAFQHARIHETLEGGSTYRESVALDSRLLNASERMLKALQYTGVAMLEYRHNSNDDSWHFLEINPRFWGSLPLAIFAGVDFPRYLYQFMVEGRREFSVRPRLGVRSRNLIADLRSLKHRAPCCRRRIREAGTAIARLLAPREHVDNLAIDDLRPGLVEIGAFGRRQTASAMATLQATIPRALGRDRRPSQDGSRQPTQV